MSNEVSSAFSVKSSGVKASLLVGLLAWQTGVRGSFLATRVLQIPSWFGDVFLKIVLTQ